eukprot:TRINITY_DN7034_c0_g1_i4.p1 TRINITY_DN7034_c0_g1~~TRINITY_DN7034_c0_g1_i4.p1  ORF type:complete len:238 (+),score=21.78 TRINITY_DN7034_c0_g1_i4:61-774(+)
MSESPESVVDSFLKTLGIEQPKSATKPKKSSFEKKWKQNNHTEVSKTIKAVRVANPAEQFRESNEPVDIEKEIKTRRNIGSKSKKIECVIVPTDPRSLDKFCTLLASDNVNINELRKICWNGIPPEVRAECWRLLLDYAPPSRERREATIQSKRVLYWDMAKQYFGTDESRSEYEKQIYHQISVDVPRTNPSVTLFQDKTCQSIFTRILYLWAIRHPASGYVQVSLNYVILSDTSRV